MKNFISPCYYKDDFCMDTEWHFFATSHGTNGCGGTREMVERLARKTSLQCPYLEQFVIIKTCLWAVWCKDSLSHLNHFTIEDHSGGVMALEESFRKDWTILGIQKIHCIIPASEIEVQVRTFSGENMFNTVHNSVIAKWSVSSGKH
jgi:hypothetical protein